MVPTGIFGAGSWGLHFLIDNFWYIMPISIIVTFLIKHFDEKQGN